ncbi:MAG: hypothetical protein J6T51_07780 [Kiritimatiellae bacterium]|nr:hypothetical protein [Kiritimatiellia bacterium]
MALHSYYVRYIERSGRTACRLVMAENASEARAKAAEGGCDDVLGARRANFFRRNLLRLLVIAVVVAVIVYLA